MNTKKYKYYNVEKWHKNKIIIKTISNTIENIIYWLSIFVCLFMFCFAIFYTYNNDKALIDIIENLANIATVFTVSSAVVIFINNHRMKKLDYSISIVEDFDKEDFRTARDLTRQIAKIYKKKIINPETIIEIIECNNCKSNKCTKEANIKDFISENSIKPEDCKNLEKSLIFVFNYWEKIYYGILFNACNDEYIFRHLSKVFYNQHNRFGCWIEKALSPVIKQELRLFKQMIKEHIIKEKFGGIQRFKHKFCICRKRKNRKAK